MKVKTLNIGIIKKLNVVICCIVFWGCSNNLDVEKIPKQIDIESNIGNFKKLELSSVASEIKYISLETTSSNLFSRIVSCQFFNNNILIKTPEKILLFTDEGKFLCEISGKGKGPSEYRLAGIPAIIKDLIYIPSIIGREKLLVFNRNGEFINAIPIPRNYISSNYKNWLVLPNLDFLLQVPNISGSEKFRILKLNSKGDTIKGYPNTTFFNGPADNLSGGTIALAGNFYIYNETVKFKEVLNDTLWELGASELIPQYIFKRGKYGMPNSFRALPREEYNDKLSEIIYVQDIFETKSKFYFRTAFLKQYPFNFYRTPNTDFDFEIREPYPILGIYDKKSKDTYFVKPTNTFEQIEPTGIYNDIDGGVNFYPKQANFNDLLISWIRAFELKQYIASNTFQSSIPKYPEKKKTLVKLADSLDDNDNPVLMLVRLKD